MGRCTCLLFDRGFIGEKSPNYPGLCSRYQTQLKRPRGEPDWFSGTPHLRPGASGPGRAWLSEGPWALSRQTGWPTRIAEKGLASSQEALDRTWASEKNLKVWLQQDRARDTRPGSNFTSSSSATSVSGEQVRQACLVETPRTSSPGCPLVCRHRHRAQTGNGADSPSALPPRLSGAEQISTSSSALQCSDPVCRQRDAAFCGAVTIFRCLPVPYLENQFCS